MKVIIENVDGSGSVQFDVLKSICGNDLQSMIDLGSGNCPTTRLLGFKEKFYIDVVNRDLGEENKYFIQHDILELVNSKFHVNAGVCLSLDNLEHFWEEDGIKIIKWMKENSKKQIVFTPQGEYMNVRDKENTHPDTHKKSWTDIEFQEMGWATITFPHFHPTLGENGLGAFFAFNCDNLEQEFNRITNELKNMKWIK